MNKIVDSWILKGLCLASILVSLAGCKKFLDQKPLNSLTKDEFFQTEADANSSIMGVYNSLQAANEQFLRWGEMRGDLIQPSNAADRVFLQTFINTDDILRWDVAYKLIANANIVIEKVPGIIDVDNNFTKDKSDKIVGEALFMRALSYFYLVRTFKDVPLVLQAPTSDAVDFLLPKTSADSVLNQIEADLLKAEAGVPVSYGRPLETRGRVTKGAVNALQADVFLWRAKYAEAATAAKKVINNSSLYQLVAADNWFDIFARKNTSESIFELQYDYQLSEVGRLKGISGGYLVNPILVDLFVQENDLIRGLNRTYWESGGGKRFWKYAGLTVDQQERAIDDANYIFYRLPDVMLLGAEALAHLGDNGKSEAVYLINRIRERAQLDTLEFVDVSAVPVDIFNELILKERAMELSMEGKRWFDLVRIATNENNPELLLSRIIASRSVANRAQIRSRLIDPRSWYLPIHRDELAKNPQLSQNPFYK